MLASASRRFPLPNSRCSTSAPARLIPAQTLTKNLAPYYDDWAHASDLRRLLEAVVHRRELPEHSGSRADHRRLVRHLSRRLVAQLRRPARSRGQCRRARARQRLLVAIGGHSGWARQVGIVDFGPDAPFDENEVTIEWYDYLFLGKQNQFADASKPVRIFVMGEEPMAL